MQNMDYHELTSQLDAREVLRYLNNLGIHNISGEVLKYFITDLKKLIKYDLENSNRSSEREEIPGLRLHSATTFSSRSRSKVNDGVNLKCTKECQKKTRVPLRNIQSLPNLGHNQDEKPLRRACSCVRVAKKTESRAESSKERTASSSNNLIKVPIVPPKKKCDPVTLYHYYTALWAKYKSNVPGENARSDLRWSVRQKLAGCDVKRNV